MTGKYLEKHFTHPNSDLVKSGFGPYSSWPLLCEALHTAGSQHDAV